jgi:hypothetical protein
MLHSKSRSLVTSVNDCLIHLLEVIEIRNTCEYYTRGESLLEQLIQSAEMTYDPVLKTVNDM